MSSPDSEKPTDLNEYRERRNSLQKELDDLNNRLDKLSLITLSLRITIVRILSFSQTLLEHGKHDQVQKNIEAVRRTIENQEKYHLMKDKDCNPFI